MCAVQVAPKDNALLVNVGDYVSMMTHGRFSSPLHRVVSLSLSLVCVCLRVCRV